MDTRTYQMSKVEIISNNYEFPADYRDQNVIAFDLDSSKALVSIRSPLNSSKKCSKLKPFLFSAAELQSFFLREEDMEYSVLDIRNYRLYLSANFDALRSLHKSVTRLTTSFFSDMHDIEFHQRHNHEQDTHQRARTICATVVVNNCVIERKFHRFWMNLILHAVPENIQYYPSVHVIGCDMQNLLSLLLTSNRCSLDKSTDAEGMGSSKHSTVQIAGFSLKELQHMSFPDFLNFYNDHTATAGLSLYHAFFAEFLAGLAPPFIDFLKRHAVILEKHAF